MNELKTNSKKTKAKIMTVPEIISISISLIAVMVSLLIFFLPLVKNHFTIEDPAVVYIRSSKNSNYDELVIPIICNNYGNFIRTINNMECTLSFEDKLLPMKKMQKRDCTLLLLLNQMLESQNILVLSTGIQTFLIKIKFRLSFILSLISYIILI
ncbi:hypothetical protein [uncultured Treponema sp.]|uniref:hypothetical protein n=1 Tax=uncultured Treponema sp. TaxID=162155 RepID=UPI00259AB1C3|nr:hypothetical protein [uncultured Treponema sp.]